MDTSHIPWEFDDKGRPYISAADLRKSPRLTAFYRANLDAFFWENDKQIVIYDPPAQKCTAHK
jgi:hypothetical protein